jgi:hypothetical protein
MRRTYLFLSECQRPGTKEHDDEEAIRCARQFHIALEQIASMAVDLNDWTAACRSFQRTLSVEHALTFFFSRGRTKATSR